jgi:hypothetical protein
LKKLRLPILVLFMVLTVAGSAPAQQVYYRYGQPQLDFGLDLNWLGSSARARAMGGAFISIVDDASALTWNPAGLIQTLDPQLSFSGVYTRPTSKFDLRSEGTGVGGFSVDENVWTVDYAAFLAPLTVGGHELSASVAYQKLNDISSARSLPIPRFAVDPLQLADTILVSSLEQEATGIINVVNLGFGTNVIGNLAFGASANIYFGNAEETSVFLYEENATYYHPLTQKPYEGKSLWRGNIFNEVSYSGFNMTFGLHYKTEKVGLAVVGKTPFDLSRKYDVTLADTVFRAAVGYTYQPLDPEPLYIIGGQKEKIGMPVTLAAGASLSITPNFLIAADVEWRRFGTSEISVLDSGVIRSSGEKDEYFSDSLLNFQNAGEARFGFEYMFRSEKATVPIRGGFRYVRHYLREVEDLIAIPDRNVDGMLVIAAAESPGDGISGYALTAGTGIHWERIWLDAAFEYYTDDRAVYYLDDWETVEVGDVLVWFPARLGEADDSFKQTRVTLNFTGFF